MSELGYPGFDQQDLDPHTAARLALSETSPGKWVHQPLAQRALAEAAYKRLHEWTEQSQHGMSQQAPQLAQAQ